MFLFYNIITDDVYNVYLEVLNYYLEHLYSEDVLKYDLDFSVENVNYALSAVSALVNLYMYSYDKKDDSGSVCFDLGSLDLRKEDLNENVDSRYHYYFFVKDLLNDETNEIIKFSKYILNDLELFLGDYYILFVYVLLKGELKYL